MAGLEFGGNGLSGERTGVENDEVSEEGFAGFKDVVCVAEGGVVEIEADADDAGIGGLGKDECAVGAEVDFCGGRGAGGDDVTGAGAGVVRTVGEGVGVEVDIPGAGTGEGDGAVGDGGVAKVGEDDDILLGVVVGVAAVADEFGGVVDEEHTAVWTEEAGGEAVEVAAEADEVAIEAGGFGKGVGAFPVEGTEVSENVGGEHFLAHPDHGGAGGG